ncbi:cation:proton antiporter [Leifsonia sp. Root112D2]|uniref:cation:proton antiporter n=1 Tax=Leifsonia sp. Root112D2 TaxID=1736426 RepID=UPI0006F812F3|nr:sodium:proton antiporter [Leifsonia sp. Root112D2]KQV06837.1 cation:proton antiporter [Leifsonia sp. Root112D2]
MTILIVMVVGLLAVAAAAAFAPRLRISAPLILVVAGIGVSFLPFIPPIESHPEWVLAGILPPLLYSASVSMPTMNFRREFTAIGGLSVALVVISSIVLGLFFAWVIPGLGLWWGIALGAIVSPTDAVATSIVKKVGVSGRVVAVLEGESLLNDATALVLLRTAIAGTAAAVSFWGVLGSFAYSVAVAVVLGFVVGKLNLWVRSKISDATVNTVLSFTVPFLASIPAELLGASGLVAAVVAGLITGRGAARKLPPQHRLSDSQNWHVIELILEGAVFLVMGLELFNIVSEVQKEHAGIGTAVLIAAGALVLTVLVRAAYVAPLLSGLRRRARRGQKMKPRLDVMQERFNSSEESLIVQDTRGPAPSPRRLEMLRIRVRRSIADIDYLVAAPLGWREGGVLVWAGMRGAVTLAAAQTLPFGETPHRALLILIAFTVAAASLLLQGGTLSAFVSWIKPALPDDAASKEERGRILALLAEIERDVTTSVAQQADASPTDAAATAVARADAAGPADDHVAWKKRTLDIIAAQRTALLDARDDGAYSAEVLNSALTNLDADQISIELKGAPPEL